MVRAAIRGVIRTGPDALGGSLAIPPAALYHLNIRLPREEAMAAMTGNKENPSCRAQQVLKLRAALRRGNERPQLYRTRRCVSAAICFLLVGALARAQSTKEENPNFEPVQVLNVTEPLYPVEVIGTGTVVLDVVVAPSGDIDYIEVVHDIATLTEECVAAVQKWKFQPAKLDGEPVMSSITAAFTFTEYLSPSPSWKAEPPADKSASFEPIRILSLEGTGYPFRSIAWGTVMLRVAVGKSGTVDRIGVIQDIPSLTEEAEQTLRKWEFQPARFDNQPLRSPMIAMFIFRPPVNPPPDSGH